MFFTFFKDLKYLGACANCLKQLVKLSYQDTLSIALQQKYPYRIESPDQCAIKVSKSSLVSLSTPDQFDLVYQQLWLVAIRYYHEILLAMVKMGKELLTKSSRGQPDENILYKLARLASNFGF